MQDALTQVFGASRMFALYLKEDEDFGSEIQSSATGEKSFEEKRRFNRMMMFDYILKANLLLQQETLKSRELLNQEKIGRLTKDLKIEERRLQLAKETMSQKIL